MVKIRTAMYQGADSDTTNVTVPSTSTTTLNPFTAPACTISGLKRCTDALANSIFSGPVTCLRFDENPFKSQCDKEDKKV